MQVWIHGQFVDVTVHDGQDNMSMYSYPVTVAGRTELVAVSRDLVQRAQMHGHERDVHVLVARAVAAVAATPGAQVSIADAELQRMWTQAAALQHEKVAAGCLHLLLAGRHRQRSMDVFGLAASLGRSVWDILHGLLVLHSYGAVRFGQGQTPNPADTTVQAARTGVALASEPPDVARLVAFAEGLAKTIDGIRV